MKNKIFLLALLIGFSLYSCGSNSTTDDETSLKASVGDKFYIGVAINTAQSSGRDTTAVQHRFRREECITGSTETTYERSYLYSGR